MHMIETYLFAMMILYREKRSAIQNVNKDMITTKHYGFSGDNPVIL